MTNRVVQSTLYVPIQQSCEETPGGGGDLLLLVQQVQQPETERHCRGQGARILKYDKMKNIASNKDCQESLNQMP